VHFIEYRRVLPFITPFLPTRRKANLECCVVLCGDIFRIRFCTVEYYSRNFVRTFVISGHPTTCVLIFHSLE